METLFFAILLGCSDDLGACDQVQEYEIRAASAEVCAEQVLERAEARKADYPSVLAECQPAEQLVADAS